MSGSAISNLHSSTFSCVVVTCLSLAPCHMTPRAMPIGCCSTALRRICNMGMRTAFFSFCVRKGARARWSDQRNVHYPQPV
jgi:hypothetical protein